MDTREQMMQSNFSEVSVNGSLPLPPRSSRKEIVEWLYQNAQKAFEAKVEKRADYYEAVKELGIFTYDDVAVLFANELPELVDGHISYDENFFGEKMRVKKDTQSKTLSLKFIELIHDLDRQDGLSIDDVLDQIQSNASSDDIFSNAITVLYLVGGQQDLINKILKKVQDPSCIIDKARALRTDIGYSKNYCYNFKIQKAMESFVEGYVKYKIPKSGFEATDTAFNKDETIMEAVALANKYAVNNSTIDHIILHSDVPQSMFEIHCKAVGSLMAHIKNDAAMALQWIDVKNNFSNLSLDEKLSFGQGYLNQLASAYGFKQPPLLSWNDEITSEAGHGVFSKEDPELCFKYPLGKVLLNPQEKWDDWECFVSSLSHELVHGTEDAAILSLNMRYQSWARIQVEQGDDVALGNEYFQEKCKAMGMLASFNSARDVLKTEEMPLGRYHASDVGYDKYRGQIRERHAFLLGEYVKEEVREVVESIEVLKEPVTSFMKAQNFVFKIYTFLKDEVDRDRGKDKGWDCNEVLENKHFEEFQDRFLPLSERLSKMGDLISFYSDKMKAALKDKLIEEGSIEHGKDLYVGAKGLVNEIRLSAEIQDILAQKNAQSSLIQSTTSSNIPNKP